MIPANGRMKIRSAKTNKTKKKLNFMTINKLKSRTIKSLNQKN